MRSVTRLIVRKHFGGGLVVALNAHGDAVPPGAGWSVDRCGGEVRDGWLCGRGRAVSKSDFTTYAFAIHALRHLAASGTPLAGTVESHLTCNEKMGGVTGPGWILSKDLSRPDCVLCAAFLHHVVVAHNGCLHIKVVVRGTSAHAARPDTGHDAIKAAAPLYCYCDRLAEQPLADAGHHAPTMVVGLIGGGSAG